MARRRQSPLIREAISYLAEHGVTAVGDVSGKHHKLRWSSGGRECILTLPKDPHGSANVASLARLRRALGASS